MDSADVRKGVKSDLTLDVHPSSGMRKQKALDLFVGLPAKENSAMDSADVRKGVKSGLTLDVHRSLGMRKQKIKNLCAGLPTKVNLCRRLADVRKGLTSDLTLDVHPSSEMRKRESSGSCASGCIFKSLLPFCVVSFHQNQLRGLRKKRPSGSWLPPRPPQRQR